MLWYSFIMLIFMIPSTRTKPPVLCPEKHPQTTLEQTSCLSVGTTQSGIIFLGANSSFVIQIFQFWIHLYKEMFYGLPSSSSFFKPGFRMATIPNNSVSFSRLFIVVIDTDLDRALFTSARISCAVRNLFRLLVMTMN